MRHPKSSLLLVLNPLATSVASRPRPPNNVAVAAFSRALTAAYPRRISRPSSTNADSVAALGGHGACVFSAPRSSSCGSSNFSTVAFSAIAMAIASSTAAVASCSGKDNPELSGQATVEVEIEEQANVPPPSFPEESIKLDTYNGVTLDVDKIPVETTACPERFRVALGEALDKWRAEGKRGIWLRLPTKLAKLIPPSTELGFDFQYAEPGRAIMTLWLPTDSESRLPRGPTHQIGVGALVLHPRTGEMLAVQEKTGPAAAAKLWKMPTGLSDPGEDIVQAAVREVKEETGLDCIFDKIICFRQAHGGRLNHSDMFFVCLLRLDPKYDEFLQRGEEIQLIAQEEEIAQASWINMQDFANQELWQTSPLYKLMNDSMINAAQSGIEYSSSDDTGAIGSYQNNGNGLQGQKKQYDTLFPTPPPNNGSGFIARTLPVGSRPGTNTIYVSKL